VFVCVCVCAYYNKSRHSNVMIFTIQTKYKKSERKKSDFDDSSQRIKGNKKKLTALKGL